MALLVADDLWAVVKPLLLWAAIANALPQFTPAECANYFTACRYEPK